MECFFSSLKNELVRHRQFQNQAEARFPIAEYIEHFYNRQGLLQAPDYWSQRSSTRWPVSLNSGVRPFLVIPLEVYVSNV
jgi:transposase InsO family protein